jgi:translation initiation factor IF-3
MVSARINNQITAVELRVIGDGGENLGVMTKDAALALAKLKGLDLIEISAKAVPPVARIMSYDKFRYQEEKKLKKQRAAERSSIDFKRVQIGFKTALNDLNLKVKKANEFLAAGHSLEIFMIMRGREKANQKFAMEKVGEFLKMLAPHKIIMTPRFTGRGISAQIVKQ